MSILMEALEDDEGEPKELPVFIEKIERPMVDMRR